MSENHPAVFEDPSEVRWHMAAEISKALLNEARVRNFDNFTPISMSNNYWYYRLFVVVAVDVLDI